MNKSSDEKWQEEKEERGEKEEEKWKDRSSIIRGEKKNN